MFLIKMQLSSLSFCRHHILETRCCFLVRSLPHSRHYTPSPFATPVPGFRSLLQPVPQGGTSKDQSWQMTEKPICHLFRKGSLFHALGFSIVVVTALEMTMYKAMD